MPAAKKNMKTKSIILILIGLMISVTVSGMSIRMNWSYTPVDSISEKILLSSVVLDLKNDSLALSLNNKQLYFYPEYKIDSLFPFYSSHYLTAKFDAHTDIRLCVQKLLSFDTDSIYISARYSYLNNQSDSNNSFYTVNSLAISKKNIKGLAYSVPDFEGKSVSLFYFGYIGNVRNTDSEKERDRKRINIIEAGLSYTKMWFPLYGYSLYGANEFAFNSRQFFIGPKIGANVSFLFLLMLGNELIYYTDFNNNSLVYKPYFGFGLGPARISVGYNILLNKRNSFEINTTSIELSLSASWLEVKRKK